MALNSSEIVQALHTAYPVDALWAARVDFVRDENGLPAQKPAGTGVCLTLRSLDWHTERDVHLPGPWGTGGQVSHLMDTAVRELNEPPPFYVP